MTARSYEPRCGLRRIVERGLAGGAGDFVSMRSPCRMVVCSFLPLLENTTYPLMRAWTFPVSVDTASTTPLFLQIARAISDDVTRGRLRPGDPLPGSRSLTEELG